MGSFGMPQPTPVDLRTGSRWWDAHGELRGINLRSWLVIELAESGRSITIGRLARSTKHRMRQRLVACRARAAGIDPVAELPEVRLAREFFTSIRTVAQTRNATTTPRPDSTLETTNAPP